MQKNDSDYGRWRLSFRPCPPRPDNGSEQTSPCRPVASLGHRPGSGGFLTAPCSLAASSWRQLRPLLFGEGRGAIMKRRTGLRNPSGKGMPILQDAKRAGGVVAYNLPKEGVARAREVAIALSVGRLSAPDVADGVSTRKWIVRVDDVLGESRDPRGARDRRHDGTILPDRGLP